MDFAETYVQRARPQVAVVRLILVIYRSLKRISEQFDQNENIVLADSCSFTPGQRGGPSCSGGLADFKNNDGSRRLLEQAREMEIAFPTYDSTGQPVSPEHRWLQSGCTAIFNEPDCTGTCSGCSGKTAKAKCNARKLKCKGKSIQGLIFPFSECNLHGT